MSNLFEQVSTKIDPDKADWYNTDKGLLFWFPTRGWSSRDDRFSDEFPKVWYRKHYGQQLPSANYKGPKTRPDKS